MSERFRYAGSLPGLQNTQAARSAVETFAAGQSWHEPAAVANIPGMQSWHHEAVRFALGCRPCRQSAHASCAVVGTDPAGQSPHELCKFE